MCSLLIVFQFLLTQFANQFLGSNQLLFSGFHVFHAKEGIHAAVIGKAVEGNDRVIFNDGEKRFLEPPKADELYRAFD